MRSKPPSPLEAARAMPLVEELGEVSSSWLDANGHMNVAHYVALISDSSFRLMARFGVDESTRQKERATFFTLESTLVYYREVLEGSRLRLEGRLFDCNEKLLHVLWLVHASCEGEDYLAASSEWLYGYVDLASKKIVPCPAALAEALCAGVRACSGLEPPPVFGRKLGIKRKERG